MVSIITLGNCALILIVSILLTIQPLIGSPLENEKLAERLDRLQSKVESLEDEKVGMTERFDKMQISMEILEAENEKLTKRMEDLEAENSQQGQEIFHLKNQLPAWALKYGTNSSSSQVDGQTSRATTPPSSCAEMPGYSNFVGFDGIQLVQNKVTKKIEAVFCQFSTKPVSENLIGRVDVKTETVHFYAQRNSPFNTRNAVIPFELVRLNEGSAFDVPSGVFTVPVPGIYHFDFSAVKDDSATFLDIFLQVNDNNVGLAHTNQGVSGSYDVVSLSASLRLKAGDRVNLFNYSGSVAFGVLYDTSDSLTHFTGWLVEEELV